MQAPPAQHPWSLKHSSAVLPQAQAPLLQTPQHPVPGSSLFELHDAPGRPQQALPASTIPCAPRASATTAMSVAQLNPPQQSTEFEHTPPDSPQPPQTPASQLPVVQSPGPAHDSPAPFLQRNPTQWLEQQSMSCTQEYSTARHWHWPFRQLAPLQQSPGPWQPPPLESQQRPTTVPPPATSSQLIPLQQSASEAQVESPQAQESFTQLLLLQSVSSRQAWPTRSPQVPSQDPLQHAALLPQASPKATHVPASRVVPPAVVVPPPPAPVEVAPVPAGPLPALAVVCGPPSS